LIFLGHPFAGLLTFLNNSTFKNFLLVRSRKGLTQIKWEPKRTPKLKPHPCQKTKKFPGSESGHRLIECMKIALSGKKAEKLKNTGRILIDRRMNRCLGRI